MRSDKPPQITDQSELTDDAALPKLELDPDKYRDNIAEFYPSKEQQDEVLRILWNIGNMVIDMNLGVDSVQMIFADLFEKAGADSGKLIEQKRTNIFNTVSKDNFKGKGKK